MSDKTYSMSMYASMEDLLTDKCKDQQEKIQSLEAELEKHKDFRCPDCGGDPELAAIAKRMGFRPDVAFVHVRRAERKAADLEKENAELRREVEHYRTFYIEVTNSDPVFSFVGGDPVGYLATNGMLSKLEKAIGE